MRTLLIAALLLTSFACDEPGDTRHSADSRSDSDLSTNTCWMFYGEDACREEGWTWYNDFSTSYCPNPGQSCSPPNDESFCALPCSRDSDCAGTPMPFCGPIAWWGGRDNQHCSSFRVCVPLKPSPSWCYHPRPEQRCPR